VGRAYGHLRLYRGNCRSGSRAPTLLNGGAQDPSLRARFLTILLKSISLTTGYAGLSAVRQASKVDGHQPNDRVERMPCRLGLVRPPAARPAMQLRPHLPERPNFLQGHVAAVSVGGSRTAP
jgi:hypothetical protein